MSRKPKVYLETTIIGYLASGTSRDVIVAGNQLLTRQWWQDHREDFDLYVSELVALELGAGNPKLAAQRLEWIVDIPYVEISPEISRLARRLVEGGPLPEKASRDAIHIALTVAHQIDFLLTWNCTHIANAFMQRKLHAILAREGHPDPPVICTPLELMTTTPENEP